jgi:hypothetical protein
MCRTPEEHPPNGLRCDGDHDAVQKAVTVGKQSMNRHLRAMDAAEEAGDDAGFDKHLAYFNLSVERLVEREAALEARQAAADSGTGDEAEQVTPPAPAPSRIDEFTDESMVDKTDDELWEIARTLHYDPEAQDRVWDIIDRRTEARNDAAALASFEEYQADGPMDWNVVDVPEGESGHEVPDLTDAEMFRMYAAAGAAKTPEEQCRDAYEQYNAAQYSRALEECSGVLLNAKGKAKKVDSYSLFQGNVNTAKAYASEELQAWWRSNGRRTYAAFRFSYLGNDRDRGAWERASREDFANVA